MQIFVHANKGHGSLTHESNLEFKTYLKYVFQTIQLILSHLILIYINFMYRKTYLFTSLFLRAVINIFIQVIFTNIINF